MTDSGKLEWVRYGRFLHQLDNIGRAINTITVESHREKDIADYVEVDIAKSIMDFLNGSQTSLDTHATPEPSVTTGNQ